MIYLYNFLAKGKGNFGFLVIESLSFHNIIYGFWGFLIKNIKINIFLEMVTNNFTLCFIKKFDAGIRLLLTSIKLRWDLNTD